MQRVLVEPRERISQPGWAPCVYMSTLQGYIRVSPAAPAEAAVAFLCRAPCCPAAARWLPLSCLLAAASPHLSCPPGCLRTLVWRTLRAIWRAGAGAPPPRRTLSWSLCDCPTSQSARCLRLRHPPRDGPWLSGPPSASYLTACWRAWLGHRSGCSIGGGPPTSLPR